MEPVRRVVMIMCAVLLLLPALLKSRTSQELPARAAFSSLSGGRMYVKVGGAVRYPGMYTVAANSMAGDVIKLAEPLAPLQKSDSGAAPRLLTAGSAVKLERHPDGLQVVKIGAMTVAERMVLGVPLDISLMNEADFERLPGIGPALARRISEYRQKNGGILRVSDLAAIEGIGEKKYKMIKKYF